METHPYPGRVPGLASVIVPSYNKAPYIQATLESLVEQTYPNIEIVVVDDASSDESVALVRAWAESHSTPLRLLVHDTNQGICKTLNDGLALAKGEFTACLAADDRYLPHKIASHVRILTDNPTASFVYGDTRIENPAGVVLVDSFVDAYMQGLFRSGKVFGELLQMNFIPALTVTMRTSALDLVGPYDESLPYEDYDMWIRLARVGELACSEAIDCVYLDAPDSLSKTLGSMIDIGHLMILAKYRDDPDVDKQRLDRIALTCARTAAQKGSAGSSHHERLRQLARASSLYGGRTFATYALVSEAKTKATGVPSRIRKAVGRLRRRQQ